MADNPLEPDTAREQRIRERAYHLWEQDGKPHGRSEEYWERARELIGMEDSAGAGELPNPMSEPDSPRVTGVEEAEIQQNLGEFPDRFADQGEVQPTPSATHGMPRQAEPPPKPPEAPRPAAPAAPKKPVAPKKGPNRKRK